MQRSNWDQASGGPSAWLRSWYLSRWFHNFSTHALISETFSSQPLPYATHGQVTRNIVASLKICLSFHAYQFLHSSHSSSSDCKFFNQWTHLGLAGKINFQTRPILPKAMETSLEMGGSVRRKMSHLCVCGLEDREVMWLEVEGVIWSPNGVRDEDPNASYILAENSSAIC